MTPAAPLLILCRYPLSSDVPPDGEEFEEEEEEEEYILYPEHLDLKVDRFLLY